MKLQYKILAVVIALVGLSSCNDFLEKVPDTRVYLQNLDQLEQLLVTCYTQTNYAALGELSSDNVIDTNSPSADGMRYNYSSYNQYDEQIYAWEDVTLDISDSDSPSGIWNGCYQAIAGANAALEKLEEFEQAGEIEGEAITARDQARMAAIKGEALMVRAYHHYILAQVFCMPYRGNLSNQYPGIPYATKPETELNPKYDRGTLQQTYDNIEKDLLEGLKNVTDEFYEVPKYHFNVAASNAFAARFYTAKREYDKVLQYAEAALKGTDVRSMRNDFWDKDFYDLDNGARYYTSVDRPGNFMMIDTYSTWLRRWGNRFWTAREGLRGSIGGPGPTWERCTYSYGSGKNKESWSMMPCFTNSFLSSSLHAEYGAIFMGNCWEQFEYTDKIAGIGYVHMIRPEFTSQELILLRAEANLFMGNIDAAFDDLYLWNHDHLKLDSTANYNMVELTKELIQTFYTKEYQARRGYESYGIMKDFHIDEVCPSDRYHMTEEIEPYMQCLQHFRRIQLIHMGNRWFDIKRFGFSITHKMGISNVYTLETLDPRYAIQIPNEVIGAGLEPNSREIKPRVVENANGFGVSANAIANN